MKSSRESDNKLPFVLQKFIDGNICILQQTRAEHRCDVMQEIRDISHLHGQVVLEYLFKPICIFLGSRHTIPLFRCTFVVIVDTVEVVVLVVPAKRREERPIVHPRHVDTIDADLDMTEDAVWCPWNIIQIPKCLLVVIFGPKLGLGKFDFFGIGGTVNTPTPFRKRKT